MSALRVDFTGLPDVAYTAVFEFQDGTTNQVVVNGPAKIADTASAALKAPDPKNMITAVTFGHQPGQTDSFRNATFIRSVGYTAATR
ncbi:hypothetical protein GCM10029964_035640 [Kibdelosporangium lantanae]